MKKTKQINGFVLFALGIWVCSALACGFSHSAEPMRWAFWITFWGGCGYLITQI